jgi:hypothetical protein
MQAHLQQSENIPASARIIRWFTGKTEELAIHLANTVCQCYLKADSSDSTYKRSACTSCIVFVGEIPTVFSNKSYLFRWMMAGLMWTNRTQQKQQSMVSDDHIHQKPPYYPQLRLEQFAPFYMNLLQRQPKRFLQQKQSKWQNMRNMQL